MGNKPNRTEYITIRSDAMADMIKHFANAYLSVPNRSLGRYNTCELGKIEDIQLCNLLEMTLQTRLSCDLKVSVDSLQGLQHAHISTLDVSSDNIGYTISLNIDLGILRAWMSTEPVRAGCNIVIRAVSTLITCERSELKIGPINVFIVIYIPFDYDLSKIEVSQCKVIISEDIEYTCFKSLSYMPENIQTYLRDTIADTATVWLKDYFRTTIVDFFTNIIYLG